MMLLGRQQMKSGQSRTQPDLQEPRRSHPDPDLAGKVPFVRGSEQQHCR